MIEESEARFIDLRFTDTSKQHHSLPCLCAHRAGRPRRVVRKRLCVYLPVYRRPEKHLYWHAAVHASRHLAASTCTMLPSSLACDVIDPADGQVTTATRAHRPPRRSLFEIFPASATRHTSPRTRILSPSTQVEFETDMHKTCYEITSESGAWASGLHMDGQNTYHRPAVVRLRARRADWSGQDLRSWWNILGDLASKPWSPPQRSRYFREPNGNRHAQLRHLVNAPTKPKYMK